eukprot:2906263-Amphidinium_carterae.3
MDVPSSPALLQTVRRHACRVGSGGTRSSLPAVHEEKVCDALREWDVSGGTRNRGRVFGVPGITSIGSDPAVDRDNAFDEPGFLKDSEIVMVAMM